MSVMNVAVSGKLNKSAISFEIEGALNEDQRRVFVFFGPRRGTQSRLSIESRLCPGLVEAKVVFGTATMNSLHQLDINYKI